MKFPALTPLFPLVALLGLVSPSQAQTALPELDNRYATGQFSITFGTTDDQFSGVDLRKSPQGTIFDFCADFSSADNTGTWFNTSSGFGDVSAKQSQIEALFYNTLPQFNQLLLDSVAEAGGTWPDTSSADHFELQRYGAAMQLALWELIHDTGGDLDGGAFTVAPAADPQLAGSRDLAVTFLDGVNGGWTGGSGLTFVYAEPVIAGSGHPGTPLPNGQDRLWVVIPEPSTALLGVFGLLGLMRRRRA